MEGSSGGSLGCFAIAIACTGQIQMSAATSLRETFSIEIRSAREVRAQLKDSGLQRPWPVLPVHTASRRIGDRF